jgi:predicted RNA methylase
MASFLTKLAEKVAAAAPVGGHAPRTSLSSLVAAVQRAAPVPPSAGRAQPRERGVALAEASPRAGGKSLESLTAAVVAGAAPRAPTKSLASISAAVLAAVPASSTRPVQNAAPAARSLPDTVTTPRTVEKSLASITTAVVAATPSTPVPGSARAAAPSVRAGTRIGFLGDTANGPSEGTVTSVDGAYFWGRLDNGRTLVRQPIALLSTPRWRVLPGASTPSVREPASAAAKSLVGVAATVEIAAAIQSVRAPASLKVDDLNNGWDTPPTQRAPVSATPVRAERASAVAPSKTHRKHVAHVVNDERHVTELAGLADVLTQGGYDPADAARLQAEGMGPDELRERIKGLPGSLGSLQHTHGLRQRNAPAATSHVPDTTTVDEAWDEPIASPPPPRIDSIKALVALPIGTVLRLVRTPQGAMSSRRALIAADKNALRFRIADPTDRDHTKLVTQALTAATLVEPRPNGFALLLQDRAKRQPPSPVAEYAFDDAVDPLSVGTWRAALGRHELAETTAERATRVAQTGEWVENARRLYQNATKPAAEATRLRDLEDAHAMHTATSLRELDPLRLERLVEATRANATYEALHALLVAAQERGAFGVPSAQFALFQREAAAIATELDRIGKGRFDPIRERIRRAITMVRHAKGFGKKLKVATAALREALDARKTALARHAPAVTSTEHADSAVVEHRAEALSQRLDQKAPCATDEGVLAATLGADKTTLEIATDLGCDVAAVGEVLARLVEQNKLRKTVAANKPERWGHDVPPWNEAWAVHRIGDRLYGDTAFLTASGQLPRFSVMHQGFGDFALETPKGEVSFNRGAGVDFPGQTGRSHLLEGKPEALALLLKEMHVEERLSEDAKTAPTANDISDAPDHSPPAPSLVEVLSPVEHRTAAARRDANIKAMWLAADLEAHPRPLSDEDRLVLAAYSDWGGIGIQKSLDKFPPGFDIPDPRQLIHAYFTPPAICAEIARLVQPLLADLVATDGRVHALEPAVGIGRFPLALSGRGFESVTWHCVEFSKLSYKMLHALRPDIDLYQGPFEGWVASHAADFAGRVKLVISNPPYGQRSYATTDDPDRSYRYKRADHYFLRRGLDLLGAGGLGIYIIPSGFLTGMTEDAVTLRTEVLRSHHLAAAFRLPNEVFSLANVVTDILFFRARGGSLTEVDEADKFILEGRYYEELPAHILGTIVPNEPGKRGWHTSAEGYTVTGEFTALPAVLDERPMCSACLHTPAPDTAPPPNAAPGTTTKATAADQIIDNDERMATVSALGHRVESFLASVANPDLEPVGWEELHHDLKQWATVNGSPAQDKSVLALAKAERGPLGKGPPGGAGWLLKAFLGKSATLIASLAEKPSWTPRFLGNPKDALQVGEHLYRSRKTLTIGELPGKDPSALFAAGWCEDSTASAWVERVEVRGQLLPPDEYLFGELWPRFDRAQARAALGDAQAAAQAARLIEIIKPATFDEIEVTPQDGFVPIELLAAWLMTMNHRDPVELVREKGLVHLANVAYEDHDKSLTSLSTEALLILGWVNHDYVVFQPHAAEGEKVDDVRLALAKDWTQRFRAWLDSDSSRQRAIEYHYQRARQGYRAHGYGSEPLKLARWNPAIVLNPHQIAGARRIDANRGGGLGFDVGVGKTFTITASLALARQAGRARRAVIVVPQPIAFQWVANLAKSLPDFRVVVIGINKKTIAHGLRKGVETSETDSPEERSRKWARFQGGEFDVAILTYDALPRTQMDHESTVRFIEGVTAIEREVEIRRRNAIKHSKGALKKYEEEKGNSKGVAPL